MPQPAEECYGNILHMRWGDTALKILAALRIAVDSHRMENMSPNKRAAHEKGLRK